MRFFLLALLGSAALGAGLAPRDDSPRPVVILVHGRGHFGQDTAALRRRWKGDLDSSLALAGLPALREEDVRLAWYADALDPGSDDDDACARRASGDSLGFADLARGFLWMIGNSVPDEDAREARGVMGDLLYALDASRRCAAERRVGAVIDAALRERRPVIVVAYSLGSLVTYGYLQARAPGAGNGMVRLLTIGSPLGVRAIRELVFADSSARLRLPPSVASVENVYDPDDVLSAPLAGILVAPEASDHATRAGDRTDPHDIARYLRDPATGAALARALCAASERAHRWCAPR